MTRTLILISLSRDVKMGNSESIFIKEMFFLLMLSNILGLILDTSLIKIMIINISLTLITFGSIRIKGWLKK